MQQIGAKSGDAQRDQFCAARLRKMFKSAGEAKNFVGAGRLFSRQPQFRDRKPEDPLVPWKAGHLAPVGVFARKEVGTPPEKPSFVPGQSGLSGDNRATR